MTTILTTATIERKIDDVFYFVTTPANWPLWHPSSVAVHGETNHSLKMGEQVVEEFIVAGKRGSVSWEVVLSFPPYRWSIQGKVKGGGTGTITYTLKPQQNGTLFERKFEYRMNNWILSLLNIAFIRSRINSESKIAVSKLKRTLEASHD